MNPNSVITGLKWLHETRSRFTVGEGSAIVFAHIGRLEHEALEKMVRVVDDASCGACDDPLVRRRLVSVVVEGLENLHHHAPERERHSVIALLVANDDDYRFAIGNAMPAVVAARLTAVIDVVNGMAEEDLKAHYRRVLANTERTEKGGAGLGLFTIARKCERPIGVSTASIDGELVFMGLEIRVARS